jgi:hypothetical protein
LDLDAGAVRERIETAGALGDVAVGPDDAVYATDSLTAWIDETAARLDEAQARTFERWPALDRDVWPNAHVGGSYAADVATLRSWLTERLARLDGALQPEPAGPSASSVGYATAPASAPRRADSAARVVARTNEPSSVALVQSSTRTTA